MSRTYIGFRQLDLLDSLVKSGPMTLIELVEDTGQDYSSADKSIKRLRKALLVERGERDLQKSRAWVWKITQEGRQALAREVERGAVPGVSNRYREPTRKKA